MSQKTSHFIVFGLVWQGVRHFSAGILHGLQPLHMGVALIPCVGRISIYLNGHFQACTLLVTLKIQFVYMRVHIYRALPHTPLAHSKSGSQGTGSAGHCTILDQKLKAKKDILQVQIFVLEMEPRTEIQTTTEHLTFSL